MKSEFEEKGYFIINHVFSDAEIDAMAHIISMADEKQPSFRKTAALFAVRRFINEIPGIRPLIFGERIRQIVAAYGGADYFVSKSIYFDKPRLSNWFVAYHQDLTIAVDKKAIYHGYGPWTKKQDMFAVQPPLDILAGNVTIRIHLDDTDETNGALKVIPGSHNKGIYRPETIDWSVEKEETCRVGKGGIMLMKPLLLHSSSRTTENKKRRVMHIEFSNAVLPDGLGWAEASIF